MKGKIGYLIAFISIMGMSACGKTEPDVKVTEPDAIVTEPDVIITELEQVVPDYTERRQQVLPDELPMETTTEEWSEKGETVFYVYRLPGKEDFLKMWVEDEQQPGKILLNGQEYPYSFGDYNPRGGENPQVYVADLNGDGELDVLMKGEAYRAQIRQEVYLSDGTGGYRELGDITWRRGSLEAFPFTVSYEDDYQIHVEMPAYDIDQTVQMQTSFSELAEELGIYDGNGKVTDYGRGYIEQPNLQSQAVRYLQADDGSVILRYEAQIEAGNTAGLLHLSPMRDIFPSLTLNKEKSGYKPSNYAGRSHFSFGNDLCYFFSSSVLVHFMMLLIADFEINS